MKKRLLSTLIILVMVVGMLPAIILNATATGTTGTTGDCTWSFDNTTGTLTVSGNGAMADSYSNGSQPWYAYKDSVKTVIIEKGVTAVSANAFREFPALVTVKIAGSVTAIGSNAFYSCTNLSTVEYYGSSNPVADSTVFFGSYCVAKVPSSYSGTVFCEKMVSATLDAANEPVTPAPAVPTVTDISFNQSSAAYNSGTNTFSVSDTNPFILTITGENLTELTGDTLRALFYGDAQGSGGVIISVTVESDTRAYVSVNTSKLTYILSNAVGAGSASSTKATSVEVKNGDETVGTVNVNLVYATTAPEITDIIISDRDGNGAVQVDTENKKYTITIPAGESETKITVTVKGNNLDKIVTDYEDMYWVSFGDSSAVLVSSDLQPTGDMQWGTSAYSTDVGTHAVKYSTDGGVTWTETGWTVEVKQETTATTPEYATKAELDEAVANLQTLINSNTATIGQIQQALADINAVLNSLDTTYVTHDELDQSLQGINHAISTIEQQLNTNIDAIADNTGSINALSTVVNGLAVTVNDLPTTAVTDALRGDLDSLSTSLSDLANRVSTNEANIATLQNQVAELNKLIEAGGTIEQIQQALTDITTTLNQLDAENRLSAAEDALKTLTDTTIPSLTQLINDDQASIDAGATELALLQTAVSHIKEDLKKMVEEDERLAGLIDSLDKNLADLATALDALEGRVTNAENAINALDTAIADLRVKIAEQVDPTELAEAIKAVTDIIDNLDSTYATNAELAQTVTNAKTEITRAYKKAIQDAVDGLNKTIADGDKANADAIAAAIEDFNALVGTIPAEYADVASYIADVKSVLENALNEAVAKLEAADKANAEALAAEIAKVTALIDALDDTYATDEKLAEAISKAESELAAAKSELKTLIDEVQGNLDSAKTELNQAIANGDTALDGKITALNEALETAKTVLGAADLATKTALTDKIDEAYATLDAAIKAVQKNLDDLKVALKAKDAELAKADAENKAALEARDSSLQTFIIIVCIISCVALSGGTAFVVWFIIDRKRRI